MRLILPEGHQEPCSPVHNPFTIEFTKAIPNWVILAAIFFLFLFSSMFSLFLLFFSYFYCYFLTIIKSCPLNLNLCLGFFSFIWINFTSFSFYRNVLLYLKAHSCKLYNNKYLIASTQKTNTEIFIFIAVLVFKAIEP